MRRSRADSYVWFLVPGTVAIAVLLLIPFAVNVGLSFTSWRGAGKVNFVGFANYQALLNDSLFWESFQHSLIFIVAMAVIPTALALVLSSAIFDYIAPRFGDRVAGVFKGAFFLPQILPIVVAGVLWGWLLQPNYGALNSLLRAVGLDSLALSWLGDPTVALLSVTVILVWLQLGYAIVIFMAGMARIDPSLHEAAQIDGASWYQRFRYVTLSELRPEVSVVVLTATVTALKVFAPIYAVTRGGPGNATIVPSYFSFFAFFTQSRVGYGAAIATVLVLVLTVVAMILFWYQRRQGAD